MAKIQEYLPEVEAQGPIGATSPNLEAEAQFGRAVQNTGQAVSQAGDLLYRRQEQQEVSNISSTISQARAEWTGKLQDQLSKGTLDADQFSSQYQDYVDSISDRYQTAGGKDYFNRQAERLGGTLLTHAANGQAVLAAKQAQEEAQVSLNANSSALMQDPSSFHDVWDSTREDIQAKVDSGLLPEKYAETYRLAAGKELAKGALRGYAQTDPGDKELGQTGAATHMLDSGAFDQFLDSDTKSQMYQMADRAAHGASVARHQTDKLAKDASDEQAEQWGQDNLPKLVANGLTPQEVLKAPLSWEEQYKWINMIDAQNKKEMRTDPAVKNRVAQQILLPSDDPNKITDVSQLSKYVGHGLSVSDVGQLNSWIKKDPENVAMQADRKRMFDQASSSLIQANPMMGIKDPLGQQNMLRFQQDLQREEQSYRQQNKPLKDLYDPNSKDYFGNKIPNYQSTPTEIMQSISQTQRSQALGIAAPGDQTANKPKNDRVRRPGESSAQFLQRLGL